MTDAEFEALWRLLDMRGIIKIINSRGIIGEVNKRRFKDAIDDILLRRVHEDMINEVGERYLKK